MSDSLLASAVVGHRRHKKKKHHYDHKLHSRFSARSSSKISPFPEDQLVGVFPNDIEMKSKLRQDDDESITVSTELLSEHRDSEFGREEDWDYAVCTTTQLFRNF